MAEILQGQNLNFLIVSLVWVLPWKAYTLWLSARSGKKGWFVALLITNTFAILEIIYVFYVIKKTPKNVLDDIKSLFK